ncbi:sal-like protein 1 [Stigmatopora argus]
MSRRKQKRPQHLVNADPGGPGPLAQDELPCSKSPSASLGSEVTSSGSASSSPNWQQDCQPPSAPRPSPGGLHAPSLPNESSPPPHWANHVAPFATSLPNTHSSLSPDFPHPSLSSQTHSPPPLGRGFACQAQSHSAVASPTTGVSVSAGGAAATSSSSRGPAAQGGGGESPARHRTSSLAGPPVLQVPPTLAVLLEELRVLQQRQIHQMQITEEICRHVLKLGGAVLGRDANPRVGGAEGRQKAASLSPAAHPPAAAASPLTCLPSSPFVQPPLSKQGSPHVNGGRTPSSLSGSAVAACLHPLSLSVGPAPRSSSSGGALFAQGNGTVFPAAGHPQELPSASTSGRAQHGCRFCGKVLSSDSSLQIHLRSHTGERPYQCPVCLSRFTTRGNLKAHFLRHREQNPELSLSLLPPALSEQTASVCPPGAAGQRRRKRRGEDDEPFHGGKASVADGVALGFLSGTSQRHPSPSSLPLPPSVDMALLSTAHSLLQLNRASAGSVLPPSTSPLSSSSLASQFKGVKQQQRFDENTPPAPHPSSGLHAPASYSQLSQLPKILFPGGASPHHLALLRPTGLASASHMASAHPLPFPFPPFPKAAAMSSPSTSDTSKLQRLVQKLEKRPQGGTSSSSAAAASLALGEANANAHDLSTASGAGAYRREMLATLGLAPNSGQGASTSDSTTGVPAANQCGVCLRVLSCARALRLHQATHLGERPFPCKLCGRSFSTKGSLRAHLATHRARPANSRALNSCPLCPRKFTNALVLQHHIRLHLGGQIPPDEDATPAEDRGAADADDAGFVDEAAERRPEGSPPPAQRLLPLALASASPKSSHEKTVAACDLQMEAPEGSAPGRSPPHRRADGSDVSRDPDDRSLLNDCEEESQADLGHPDKAQSPDPGSAAVRTDDGPGSPSTPKPDGPPEIGNGSSPPGTGLPALGPEVSPARGVSSADMGLPRESSPSEGERDDASAPPPQPRTGTEEEKESSESPETAAASGPRAPNPRLDKPYSCTQCGKTYASRSGLKGHAKTHAVASAVSAKAQSDKGEAGEEPPAKEHGAEAPATLPCDETAH